MDVEVVDLAGAVALDVLIEYPIAGAFSRGELAFA
jgi:hypothetical protein